MNVFLIKDINNPTIKPIHIDERQQIGSGGMGSVWRIGNVFNTGNLVAKLYHNPSDPKVPSEEKLRAMIARTPDHVQEVINGVRYTQFAWPLYLIKDEHQQFIGFAMPELDFNQSISLNPFMYPREATRLSDYQNSLNYRVQLGANISALMADLHRHQHAFIDFKEQNLRLMPEPLDGHDDAYKGFIVGFIDCDSFLVTDKAGQRYPCSVISPEMTSPEYHQHKDIAKLDEKHDRFVLAIELFKILNYGIHPFYFIPLSERLRNLSSRVTDNFIKERLYAYGLTPHPEIAPLKNSIHECWDDETRRMFDLAFLSQNPAQRPSADQWESHLRGLSQRRQFTVCQRFPDAISHIHFLDKPCHRCWLDGSLTPKAANFQQSPYGAGITNDGSYDSTHNTNEPILANQSVWQNPPTATAPTATAMNQNQPNLPQAILPHEKLTAQKPVPERAADERTRQQNAILADTAANTVAMNAASTAPAATPVLQATSVSANPPSEPPINQNTNATTSAITSAKAAKIKPVTPKAAKSNTVKSKKNTLGWLMPVVVLALGGVGYGYSQGMFNKNFAGLGGLISSTKASQHHITTQHANANNAAATYAAIMQDLPQAVADIEQSQQDFSQKTAVSSQISAKAAATLYDDTLDISPEFFAQVVSTAATGQADLQKIQSLGEQGDVMQTQALTMTAFRNANLDYFNSLPTNKSLAKQLNEAAKSQYWSKNNPQAALYLQAQAVKNAPTQAEYAANLAFYLSKNNYPYTKEFMLYALQMPRDNDKYANTFMIELAAGLAAQAGDDQAARGALLAQLYTTDDKAKRCLNMLKYPQTYPQLVAPAQQAFGMIEQQANEGKIAVPSECLPPHDWVN